MRQPSTASDHEYHEIPEHMKKSQINFGSYMIPPAPKPVSHFSRQCTTINVSKSHS